VARRLLNRTIKCLNSSLRHRRPIPGYDWGFTLIELLTVIAIIGILAAILIPTVGKVRKTSKFSINVSNVRQWTVACTLHMQEWKGFVPYQGSGSLSASSMTDVTPYPGIGVLPWWNALPPYIGQKRLADLVVQGGKLPAIGDNSIWVSPLAENNNPANAWAAFLCYAPARSSNTPGSSAVNQYVANFGRLAKNAPRAVPSRTVMFGETPHFTVAQRSGVPYPFFNAITSPNSVGPDNRNGSSAENGGLEGKAAMGMYDGSVRTFTGAQIATHGTDQNAERGQNPDSIVWRLTPN
jgi:prepilin-type N-terminal cleavage/methylation domain-containing protein